MQDQVALGAALAHPPLSRATSPALLARENAGGKRLTFSRSSYIISGAQAGVIEHEENTAIPYALYPFGLLDTALETMPLLTVKRFRSIGYNFHIANAFRRLDRGQVILVGPTEKTTECSQPPVDGRWSSWRKLFLEKLTIGTNIRRGDLIDLKYPDLLG